MEVRRTADEVRTAFRDVARTDREGDGLRTLVAYQRLFAGHDALVAEEYARIAGAAAAAESTHDGGTVVSDARSPRTLATGGGPAASALAGPLGPFRLVRELGAGGMGRVWRATCTRRSGSLREGQDVALKVVHPHLVSGEGFFKRFLREGEIGRRLRHPNVVRTLDVDAVVEAGVTHHVLVMEYVEGRTLRSLLAEMGRVPEELCRHLGREAALGLAAIHALGVVHRDFKPDNVLVTPDHQVKVMDLGVARLAEEVARLSMTGAFVGTLAYAAPEQFGGGDDLDGRADLYALGLTLYELATGSPAFADTDTASLVRRRLHEDPRPPSALNPQISAYFEEVVRTLLARDRERRFPSAKALADVLEAGEASPWWRRRSGELRSETRRPLRRIRIPRETALFGRDAETARLRDLFAAAKSGEGRVLLLEGEAGIGKSRLVDEFAALLQREGEECHFLFGSYPPGGAATAAGAFSTAFREYFGGEGLDAALAERLRAMPLVAPPFAALLRGEPPPAGTEPLSKDSLHTAFVETARSLARECPVLLLVDDLHHAPDEGRALFAALALAVPGHRVLLVGTARPDLPAEWTASLERLPHVQRLPLPRLGAADLQRLLAEAFRSEALAEELGGRIAAKSDGNPFFAFEILRSLREGGALRRVADGTWARASEIREIEIPSSVQELVRARVARLSEDERHLLDVAACCGFEFDPLLAGEVLGLARIPVLQRLGGIEKAHRLVRSAGRRYLFDHHQVQEVLYAAIPDLLREEYHGAIGEALERRATEGGAATGPPSGAAAHELCRHYLAGSEPARAMRVLQPALDHLEQGSMTAEAIALARCALRVPALLAGVPRAEVVVRAAAWGAERAEASEWIGDMREALRVADSIGPPSLRAVVRVELARILQFRGEHEEAARLVEEAAPVAAASGDAGTRGRVLTASAGVHFSRGDYERSLAAHQEALRVAREIGEWRPLAIALGNVAAMLTNLGRLDQSLQAYDEVLAIVREHHVRDLEHPLATNIAICLLRAGEFERALGHAERALALATESGARRGAVYAMGTLSAVHDALGDLGRALALRARQLELAREIALRPIEVVALCSLGATLSDLGDADRAERTLREALERSSGLPRGIYEASARLNLAVVLDRAGDLEGAERMLRVALDLRRSTEMRDRTLELLFVLAELLARADRREEAVSLLREGLGAVTAPPSPTIEARIGALLAMLHATPPEPVVELLGRTATRMRIHDRMQSLHALWRATANRAQLDEARRLLLHLRDHAPPEYRESLMENVPLHREIETAWRAAAHA